MPKTTDAVKILAHLDRNDPKMQRMFAVEVANRDLSLLIFELREKAGISQAELARRVGTTQSVISRLEDADYYGHSFAMLSRIVAALQLRMEIRFVPLRRRPKPGPAAGN